MAVKKLKFNKDGLVEEKDVDKKTPIPARPPPRRPKREGPPIKPVHTVRDPKIKGKQRIAGATSSIVRKPTGIACGS